MEPRMVRERYLNRHQAGHLLSGQLNAYRKRSQGAWCWDFAPAAFSSPLK
jgi:hypothetical protein